MKKGLFIVVAFSILFFFILFFKFGIVEFCSLFGGEYSEIKSITRGYKKLPNYDKIELVDDDGLDKFSWIDTSSGRRALSNTWNSPSIITWDDQTKEQIRYFYRYLFRTLRRYSSQFLLYPFPVTYSPPNASSIDFKDGGFISIEPKNIKYDSNFKHFETADDVTFYRSKALYDANIAVMKLDVLHNGMMKDLFYESDVYCSMLVTYIGHWGVDCIQGKDFKAGGATKFVFLNATELSLLTVENFGIFVLPDIIIDTENDIIDHFGSSGVSQIKQFVSDGGVLYASAKSVALLELLGFFPADSYQKNKIVYSSTNVVTTKGCSVPPKTQANSRNDRTFIQYTLCSGNPKESYLLSSYLLADDLLEKDGSIRVISSFDETDKSFRIKNLDDGSSKNADSKSFVPVLLHKPYGRGEIVAGMSNPGYHSDYFGWFYSALFLSFSKDLAFERGIDFADGIPIPAMESGVRLYMNTTLYNVYNYDMTKVSLKFYVPKKVDVLEIISNGDCNKTDFGTAPLSDLNTTGYLCYWGTLAAYDSADFRIRVELLDASVTQKKDNVLMNYATIQYTDAFGVVNDFPIGSYTVDTKVAAVLRCNVNPDPSSFYPIKGRGNYIDNVMPCENKEDTIAYDVEHIAVVPLVSPAVDGSDQSKVIEILRFWNEYYDKSENQHKEYPFPFVNLGSTPETRDHDYLDYKFLSGKGVLLNADWDTAVKAQKENRGTDFPDLTNSSIDLGNVNYSTTVTNQDQVLRQVYYADSDMFFEHATQRQLVFVDTTTEAGAKAKYKNQIHSILSADEIRPGTNVTKIEYSFIRSDVYFYDSDDQYVLPVGLNYSHVISVDKYPLYGSGCVNSLSKIMVPGYFDKSMPGGLKYNEYGNELLNRCDKIWIHPTEVESLTKGYVKYSRYLLPINDDRIKEASDLLGFNETSGKMIEYPEVIFRKGHHILIQLDPAITRRGGKINVTLPYSFKNNAAVFFSADHVAFPGDTTIEGNMFQASFKRGLMPNENWGKVSIINVYLEELDVPGSVEKFNGTIDLYELKYDITKSGFEEFIPRKISENIAVSRVNFFSLPAIRMHFRLNRSDAGDRSMKEYELIEPLARYGVYYQELLKHRTVWGLAESHLVSDPGQVSKSGGFSLISQVGISSIPFIDYLTVGAGQVIPAGLETSRVTWKDIWGRKWVQPLRSVFPDVPPIPPPLRNFMMTTTFEVTDPVTGDRVLEWDSEIDMDIFVKIKLKNNYPKYFEITTCPQNQIYSISDIVPAREFKWPVTFAVTSDKSDHEYLSLGHRSYYGECFMETGTILSGESLTQDMINRMTDNLEHCATNLLNCTECIDKLRGIPTVSRRRNLSDPDPIWNYAGRVKGYYPNNYIKPNMWDLTHYDYDDNAFDKAYKYHMDNNLPNIDIGIKKPHNIIAQPIWKGYGYQVIFKRDYSVKKYPKYKGWWSDNLQNKDHTVLAGHDLSYDVSVDKESDELIPSWVAITDLADTGSKKFQRKDTALKNIYACLFNRYRVRMKVANEKTYYVNNVYPNNVIPIIPSLNRYGPEYDSYNCDLNQAPYSPFNISKIDNQVFTTDARDWLYFGANLRGNAFETVNVVYQLKPFTDRKFEGLLKVNDGGRFVYWNPANGPNSFLIVDNPVSVMNSVRCDCELEIELFPKSTTTFNSEIYHLVSISDPAEINREYPISTTIEHYGFGDLSTSSFVGGTEGSIALLNPGETTYAKITVYNNAGFDFNMFGSAIDFDIQGHMAINADDLMKNTVHAIKVPTSYNFMNLTIPDELKNYITIIPSDHNKKVAPLFFDFQNINTVTIQDGFKADYFYKITLNSSIPDSLRGKLHKIKIDIVEKHFERLPSYNDPTKNGYHDYHLKIPPITFGIKFGSNVISEYQGKVYYISGQSNKLNLTVPVLKEYEILGIRLINKSSIETLRTIAANAQGQASKLRNFFDELPITNLKYQKIPNSKYEKYNTYYFNISSLYDKFPKREFNDRPPTAEFFFLVKSKADQIEYGFNNVNYEPLFQYNACQKRLKSSIMKTYPNYRRIHAKGPFLQAEYSYELFSSIEEGVEQKKSNPDIHPNEFGIMRIDITVTNIGSDVAYNLNLTFSFPKETVTFLSEQMKNEKLNPNNYEFIIDYTDDETSITIITNYDFAPGIYEKIPIYVAYNPPRLVIDNGGELDDWILEEISPDLSVINFAYSGMDLMPTPGEVQAKQNLDGFKVAYTLRERDEVELIGGDQDQEKCTQKLKANANVDIYEGEKIIYQFYWRNYTTDPEEEKKLTWMSIKRSEDNELTFKFPCGEEVEFKVETQSKITGSVLAEDTWIMRLIPWNSLFALAVGVFATAMACYCFICTLICVLVFTLGGSFAFATIVHPLLVPPAAVLGIREKVEGEDDEIGHALLLNEVDDIPPPPPMDDDENGDQLYVTSQYFVRGRMIDVIEKATTPVPEKDVSVPPPIEKSEPIQYVQTEVNEQHDLE